MSLYLAALFFAFVPGVLVTLPKGGSKMTVLAVHALLFVLVWHFTHKMVWRATEGFANPKEQTAKRVMQAEKVKEMQAENAKKQDAVKAPM